MDFVRLIDCFRLGRRVRLGINMVSVRNCGLLWFIPARAGEPAGAFLLAGLRGVYPRACGGTTADERVAAVDKGLSPRVRGNPREGGRREWGDRVYPRACGGTTRWKSRRERRGGLSPRVRGNLGADPVPAKGHGSIPARAGEPLVTVPSPFPIGVYPRACGGTSCLMPSIVSWTGLSPRVRGNPLAN